MQNKKKRRHVTHIFIKYKNVSYSLTIFLCRYKLIVQSCESCKRRGRNKSTTAWCMECSEPLCMTCADAHKRNKFTLQHEVIFASTDYEMYGRKSQNMDDKNEFRQPSLSYGELSHEYKDVKNQVIELIEINEQNETKLIIQENEVINAIEEVKQEIKSKVFQLESELKQDLSSKIDESKHSYSAQKKELLKVEQSLENFHQHLESMKINDVSNKKNEPVENMAKELSSIKDKLELTKSTLQRFSITLLNKKVFRIQTLGSVDVKSENYNSQTNGTHEHRQGHLPVKRINVHESNTESQSLSKIFKKRNLHESLIVNLSSFICSFQSVSCHSRH